MTIITYKNPRSTSFAKDSPEHRAFPPRPERHVPRKPLRESKPEEKRPRGTLTLFHPCLQS